jgi:hypothetical protein
MVFNSLGLSKFLDKVKYNATIISIMKNIYFSILMIILLSFSPLQLQNNSIEENIVSHVDAREGEIDCTGLTFGDLFEYGFASFEIDILDDWATADYYANSWANGSNGAVVRENLDELIGSHDVPGGSNGWLSTDERDAVRAISPDCIADMDTRIGLKEGVAHRSGVDWNNWSFVQDGIALDEVNLVPSDHQEKRTCQNLLASNGCYEVPVSATDDLEISMFLADGETYNAQFNQLPNQGAFDFTLALNVTNVTDAIYVFTFPQTQGLRVLDFSTLDDGIQNDALETPVVEYLPDGRLRVSIEVEYPASNYPTIREMYIDFTDAPPTNPEAPIWADDAPKNNSIIPIITGVNNYTAVYGNEFSSWATGVQGAFFNCDFEQLDWTYEINLNGDLLISSPEGASTSSAECSIRSIDNTYNQETRNFTFGQPMSITASVIDRSILQLTIIPTGLVEEFTIIANAVQYSGLTGTNNATGPTNSMSINSNTETMILSIDSLKPGSMLIESTVSADNMLPFIFDYFEPDLSKESLPPEITVNKNLDGENATWADTGLQFTLSGTVSDPDGEDVALTLDLCGSQTNNFNILGFGWEVEASITTCLSQDIKNYYPTITAEDESGMVTILVIDANPDADFDGFKDNNDAFPNNPNEWVDSDGDGVGDNADAFPNDATETIDSDSDGTGDNSDVFPNNSNETMDSDLDGIGDNADAFPNDATETIDSDSDGTGDNSDVFPNNSNETMDSDLDGIGDNADAFPNDANETMDTDGDGVGDNSQAVSEAKAAKLAAEQSELYMMIGIAAVVIILSLAAVAVFMKKKDDEPVLITKGYDTPQPVSPQSVAKVVVASEVQRWTDDSGHSWRTMSDETTQWWNGNDWQQR